MSENGEGPRSAAGASNNTQVSTPDAYSVAHQVAEEWAWPVFPIWAAAFGSATGCACNNVKCEAPGKHPRTPNGHKNATTDPTMLSAWNSQYTGCNWAAAMDGRADAWVIDVDPRNGGLDSFKFIEPHLPEMYRKAWTGGGGWHVFVEWADGIPPSTDLPGIDIKANGYVLLPGSNHISGGTYRWADREAPLAPATEGLLAALRRKRGAKTTSKLLGTDDILKGVPEGKRDDTLFKAACRWRRQLGDNRKAVETLALAAARACDPPFPDDQAIKCVESAFKQDHSDEQQPYREQLLLAMKFAERFSNDLMHVSGIGWFYWDGRRWANDRDKTIEYLRDFYEELWRDARDLQDGVLVREALMKGQTRNAMSGVIALAGGLPEMNCTAEELDQDPYLLNCANGTLDLRTLELRAANPADRITFVTRAAYNPDAVGPNWSAFLDSSQADVAVRAYLQRYVGMSLMGHVKEQKFALLVGPTRSGKGTFAEAVQHALGDYAHTAPATMLMATHSDQHSTEEAALRGKRWVVMDEVNEGRRLDDAKFKAMTGGSKRRARFMRENSFEFMPSFHFAMTANYAPKTNSRDDAVWERLKVVPFPNRLPDSAQDRDLGSKLQQEADAILAWAVVGLRAYVELGRLTEPPEIEAASAGYREEFDYLTQFIEDRCEVEATARVPAADLWATWLVWARANNAQPMGRNSFYKAVKDSVPGVFTNEGHANKLTFYGLGLKQGSNMYS